jgi:DNA (cytosine-5)-methyltransferase 1
LFAGIGGIELGLQRAGHHAELLCESWEPAAAVLRRRFPEVPLVGNVRELPTLPEVDILAAGFPCTDLSQAGRTAGIAGAESSLVGEVFRLLRRHRPTWLLLENVRNMLPLDGGKAMRYLTSELTAHGYRWAYRVVDSRFTGVPQRRHRVLLLASPSEDPRAVLFANDAGDPPPARYRNDSFGFYWTEGLRGLGWAPDAVPPLKGGSGLGIPSPPAVWIPGAAEGRRLVVPSVVDAEVLQGFPRGWTGAAEVTRGRGPRWKLVGNAVTVGAAEWLGTQLAEPGSYDDADDLPVHASRWPEAAWGDGDRVWRAHVSHWPDHAPYTPLTDIVDPEVAEPLSHRAVSGFLGRMRRSSLRFDPEFQADVEAHATVTDPASDQWRLLAP